MYGIRDGYQHREHPEYFHDVQSDGKLWQPDVLPIAAHLARRAGLKSLVDIGCGRGEKLLPYGGEFDITGFDYGDNILFCKNYMPFGRWFDHDLEQGLSFFYPYEYMAICSDVIEHLTDASRLIEDLAKTDFNTSALILTTPDRERVYGYDHSGPPDNVHHTVEWTLPELRTFLSAYLPALAWAGWTLNNNIDRELSTCMLIFGNVDMNGLDALFTLERAA